MTCCFFSSFKTLLTSPRVSALGSGLTSWIAVIVGRFSGDHQWLVLGDHRGENAQTSTKASGAHTVHFGVHFSDEGSQHHRVPPPVPLIAGSPARGRNRDHQAWPAARARRAGAPDEQRRARYAAAAQGEGPAWTAAPQYGDAIRPH